MKRRENLASRVGSTVRALRLSSGLTQARLAELVDMTSDEVSRIERGAREPRFDTLERLARALAVDPVDLFASLGPGVTSSRGGPGERLPDFHLGPRLRGLGASSSLESSFMFKVEDDLVGEPPPDTSAARRAEKARRHLLTLLERMPDEVAGPFAEACVSLASLHMRTDSGR